MAISHAGTGLDADPCKACKPKTAEWSWKANGYSLGTSADDAHDKAREKATASACKTSATYLDAQKLKCSGKCKAGEQVDECASTDKKPKCTTGTYEKNKGMWTFICRKHYQGADKKPACDKEEAKKHPGYGMCDINVKAVRTLPCTHPDCTDKDSE